MSFNDEINKLTSEQNLQSIGGGGDNAVQPDTIVEAPSAQALQEEQSIKPVTAPTPLITPVPQGNKDQSGNVVQQQTPKQPASLSTIQSQPAAPKDITTSALGQWAKNQIIAGANSKHENTIDDINKEFDNRNTLKKSPFPALSDEQYTNLSQTVPDSTIESWLHPKAGSNILQQLYETNIHKPEVPDENKLLAARNVANIGDALGSLVELISGANGSTIEKRDMSKSASAGQEARQDQIRALYAKNIDDYAKGHLNAQYQDYMNNLQQAATIREAMQKAFQEGGKILNDKDKNDLERIKAKVEAGQKLTDNEIKRITVAAQIVDQEGDRKIAQQNATTNSRKVSLDEKEYHDKMTVPVVIAGKTYNDFSVKQVDEVVARAIKDGIVSKVPQINYNPLTGEKSTEMVPVTDASKLSDEQKALIFNAHYNRYLNVAPNGKITIRSYASPSGTAVDAQKAKQSQNKQNKWSQFAIK